MFIFHSQMYFCNGTRWDAVPEVLSQDSNRNGDPEPFSLVSV
jgi:hypothetical protein